MNAPFCTTNPGALTEEGMDGAHRIEICQECRHTHWTTQMGAEAFCDACYDALLVENY